MKLDEFSHKRFNILTGEWILVSPHRSKRPWQGKKENIPESSRPTYDSDCYLCPGNSRALGKKNPDYKDVFAFTNDFAALLPSYMIDTENNESDLLIAKNVRGVCRVICFTPRHDLTLPLMEIEQIISVIKRWKEEFYHLAKESWIKNIQIFENKGELMGCSNPHPHGQIWAQSDLPMEILKETQQQKDHFKQKNKSLLQDYLELELKKEERIICSNADFVAIVPFWATWPFETIIIGRRHFQNILDMNEKEIGSLADILKRLTTKYDNLFNISFPYSAGIHQAPVNDGPHHEWHWHMHFYPPLLRSASVKKFMVGYELLANPQRDITAEFAAKTLKDSSEVHYSFEAKIQV